MTVMDVLRFLASADGYINDHLTKATLYAGSPHDNPKVAEQELDYRIFKEMKEDGLISSKDPRMPPKDHYKITDKGRAKISG